MSVRDPEELRALAGWANDTFVAARADADQMLSWAAAEFGSRLAVTSSMADGVVPHLVSRYAPGVDVLFIDTGYHFAETIGTRDQVAWELDVRVVNIEPTRTVERQDAFLGARLHDSDPATCCRLRKIEPLAARAVGLRRLGHRGPPRRDPAAGRDAVRLVGRAQPGRQDRAHRGMDRGRRPRLHR